MSDRLNREYEKYQAVNATAISDYQTNFDAHTVAEQVRKTKRAWGILLVTLLFSVFVIYGLYRVRTKKYRRIIEQQNAHYMADFEHYTQTRNELHCLQQAQKVDQALIAAKIEEIRSLQQKLADYQEDRQKPENWALTDAWLNAEAVLRLHYSAARGSISNS